MGRISWWGRPLRVVTHSYCNLHSFCERPCLATVGLWLDDTLKAVQPCDWFHYFWGSCGKYLRYHCEIIVLDEKWPQNACKPLDQWLVACVEFFCPFLCDGLSLRYFFTAGLYGNSDIWGLFFYRWTEKTVVLLWKVELCWMNWITSLRIMEWLLACKLYFLPPDKIAVGYVFKTLLCEDRLLNRAKRSMYAADSNLHDGVGSFMQFSRPCTHVNTTSRDFYKALRRKAVKKCTEDNLLIHRTISSTCYRRLHPPIQMIQFFLRAENEGRIWP